MFAKKLAVLVVSASLLILSGISTVLSAPVNAGQWKVDFDGFGPVRFGMTVPQASKALGIQLKEDSRNPGDVDYAGCHYASNRGKLKGVGFMISNGRIVRVDIDSGNFATAQSAQIGTTEKEIKRIYPTVKSSPNKYEETAHDLEVSRKERNGSTGIFIFVTDGSKVVNFRVGNTNFRNGNTPTVKLIEHCG